MFSIVAISLTSLSLVLTLNQAYGDESMMYFSRGATTQLWSAHSTKGKKGKRGQNKHCIHTARVFFR